MIAVVLASRGLVHSRTMQDILANALGKDELGFYFSHGNPIPECQNIIIEEALLDEPEYIWMCEDDNQYPPDILKELLEANADIAVADYPVRGNKHSVTYIRGVFQYAGLGCVLVRPWVFERLKQRFLDENRAILEEWNVIGQTVKTRSSSSKANERKIIGKNIATNTGENTPQPVSGQNMETEELTQTGTSGLDPTEKDERSHSTALSWKKNSAENSSKMNQSTISTESETTTGQRTSNYGWGQFVTDKEPQISFAHIAQNHILWSKGPYFRTDTEYVMTDEGLMPTQTVMGNHGLSDVDFWQRCIELDLDIKVIDTPAGHYYLKKPELPKFGNNTALEYEVVTWSFT